MLEATLVALLIAAAVAYLVSVGWRRLRSGGACCGKPATSPRPRRVNLTISARSG